MKRMPLIVAAAVVACVGWLSVSLMSAQQRTAPPVPRTGAALVDMGSIVQNSVRLKTEMERLKGEYQAKAEILKKEGERGNKITEDARKMPPGSPERKKLEQEILTLRADFELHGKRVTEDAREGEMKVVYSMLRELKEELTRYAQATGVPLVLRYDPTPPNLTDNRAILQEIQKPIVYQRDSEITPAILESMNRRATSPAANRAPAQSKSPLR